jgi:tetratricopeptide (TPR) repeat protein
LIGGEKRTIGLMRVRQACWAVMALSFLALVPLQQEVDRQISAQRRIEELLYVPSGRLLRPVCLGHEGLVADIYWTRAVQYFGRKRIDRATEFELLGPLLRITTELDPHLIVAYRFGAIFLAEKTPWGAGHPEEALQILRRGIVANPRYWRLWQDVGFIYYWDLKDYPRAAEAFRVGSERPGAHLWMKAMAASVAAQGGATSTSRLLWSEIYSQAGNESMRRSAVEHLQALQAREEMDQINALLKTYEDRAGRPAQSFRDLAVAAMLKGVPEDPSGAPYIVTSDGHAGLGPGSKINLTLLQ